MKPSSLRAALSRARINAQKGESKVLLYTIKPEAKIGEIKETDLWNQAWMSPRKLTFMMPLRFKVETQLRELKLRVLEEIESENIKIYADWSQTCELLENLDSFINKRDISRLGTAVQNIIQKLNSQPPTTITTRTTRPVVPVRPVRQVRTLSKPRLPRLSSKETKESKIKEISEKTEKNEN